MKSLHSFIPLFGGITEVGWAPVSQEQLLGGGGGGGW
jgi:hypothetical protein